MQSLWTLKIYPAADYVTKLLLSYHSYTRLQNRCVFIAHGRSLELMLEPATAVWLLDTLVPPTSLTAPWSSLRPRMLIKTKLITRNFLHISKIVVRPICGNPVYTNLHATIFDGVSDVLPAVSLIETNEVGYEVLPFLFRLNCKLHIGSESLVGAQ